ncbi:hypothetical protein J1N35_007680 [Gossypium stocksii]|uniref:RNase H type-1 domain-containing protein n=1 Tax=Gossypium stocksii TaxID=47602 RepID=A0A9D3W7Z1_9ROSI|nr:hypothetical protein J1N35_007680 [Gossypium stocksii]
MTKLIFLSGYHGCLRSILSIEELRLQLRYRLYWLPSLQVVRWPRQPSSLMKINVDASFSLLQKKACLGIIIRDEQGQIMGACSRLTCQVPTAFAVEALAVIHGLRFAFELGF